MTAALEDPVHLAVVQRMAEHWAADSDALDLADDRALVRHIGRAEHLVGELLHLLTEVQQGGGQ